MKLKPIGIIHSPFKHPQGTPIQPTFAKGIEGTVEVFDEYTQGLKDLDGFERIWLIYWFDRSKNYKLTVIPYMDTNERGLFATRAPARPNPIGISPVRLNKIEKNKIYISDLDILDNTPLLDIKPYSPRFDIFKIKKYGWLENVLENKTADERFYKKEEKHGD